MKKHIPKNIKNPQYPDFPKSGTPRKASYSMSYTRHPDLGKSRYRGMNQIFQIFKIWNISALILIFGISCQNQYKNLTLQTTAQKEIPSIFHQKEKATVFNTSFQFKEYFASGLMIIKPIEKETFRIVFTAKTGQKILDTELNPDSFKINSVIKQLDKKLLINLLEKDLRLICANYSGKFEIFENELNEEFWRIKTKNGWRHFIFDTTDNQLKIIGRGSKKRRKVDALLENYQDSFPEKITFAHQNFDLKIEMKLIQ